jgi:methyltransferase
MWPSLALLALVTLQRLAELLIARRNTLSLIARGAREVGAEHYPYMVLLHTVWLAGLWVAAPGRPVNPSWFLVFIALQLLRVWVLATLKGRWTTRIIVLPGEALIRRGPYRFLAHPNYLVVIGEIAVVPLAFGLPYYALVFSLLNAAMLRVRIGEENAALAGKML